MKPEEQMDQWVDEAVAALGPAVTEQSILAYVQRNHGTDMEVMRQEIKTKNRRFYVLFTLATTMAFAADIAIGHLAFDPASALSKGMGIVVSVVSAGVLFALGYWLGRRVLQRWPRTGAVELAELQRPAPGTA